MSCAAPGPALALDATGYMGIHVDTCGYMWIYGCMYICICIYIYIYPAYGNNNSTKPPPPIPGGRIYAIAYTKEDPGGGAAQGARVPPLASLIICA